MRWHPRCQKNLIFFLLKNNFFLHVFDCFYVLILKMIFFKKNIILMHFDVKSTLKSNHNHNQIDHPIKVVVTN
jgi:hypothetical protein